MMAPPVGWELITGASAGSLSRVLGAMVVLFGSMLQAGSGSRKQHDVAIEIVPKESNRDTRA
jgi:hypothetical protein